MCNCNNNNSESIAKGIAFINKNLKEIIALLKDKKIKERERGFG